MRMMTDKQRDLIECMNEFCDEKFDLSIPRTLEEAMLYISRNIEQYKLNTMSSWGMQYM